MADFSINATSLQAPQGAGSQVVSPVATPQESSNMPLIGGIVDIFAKGLVQNRAAEQEARKQAVVGAYSKEMGAINEALITGQIDPAKAGMLSRKITNTYQANNSAYTTELVEARKAFEGGTEIGEAQKRVEADKAMLEADRKAASGAGFTFYPGESQASINRTVDLYKNEVRYENRVKKEQAAAAEARAVASEGRAEDTHRVAMNNETLKKTALDGLFEMAHANLDDLAKSSEEISLNASMSPEQKRMAIDSKFVRVKSGLLAVSKTNPELAAPYNRLIEEMQANAIALTDTTKFSSDELKKLQNQAGILKTKQQLVFLANPKFLGAVVANESFNNNAYIGTAVQPEVAAMMAQIGLGPNAQKEPAPAVVGIPQQKQALTLLEKTIADPNISPKGKEEVVHMTNEVMKQTANGKELPLDKLKELSSFYSSAAFGKLSTEGRVDMATMQQAKQVFQLTYNKAVKESIMDKLDSPVVSHEYNSAGIPLGTRTKGTLIDTVDIKFSGGGVKFVPKMSGKLSSGGADRDSLVLAEKGLNQILYMAAHMEGTTNYEKYWNDNKSQLLPGVFVAGHEEGKIINGYKFLGGDARNPKNYVKVENAK